MMDDTSQNVGSVMNAETMQSAGEAAGEAARKKAFIEAEGGEGTPPPQASDMSSSLDDLRRKKKPKLKESVVDHTYRDYSHVDVSSDEESDVKVGGKAHSKHLNFPAKLHAILSDPSYQHIICWQPHGRSWKIVDKFQLTSFLCPRHFSHNKFESFNRSVNGWGFKRLHGDGPDKKCYYHECFLRGCPKLTKLMERRTNMGKRLPDKAGEPNFYEISQKFPLPNQTLALPPSHTGVSGQQNAATPSQPMANPGQQPMMFASPHQPQANEVMYGYQTMHQPPVISPHGANVPQQQPQQVFYQMPFAPSNHPGMPGYYPYPQMMMMAPPQAGQPGPYYFAQPYHQPAFHGQYYPPVQVADGRAMAAPLADTTGAVEAAGAAPSFSGKFKETKLASTAEDVEDDAKGTEEVKQEPKEVKQEAKEAKLSAVPEAGVEPAEPEPTASKNSVEHGIPKQPAEQSLGSPKSNEELHKGEPKPEEQKTIAV